MKLVNTMSHDMHSTVVHIGYIYFIFSSSFIKGNTCFSICLLRFPDPTMTRDWQRSQVHPFIHSPSQMQNIGGKYTESYYLMTALHCWLKVMEHLIISQDSVPATTPMYAFLRLKFGITQYTILTHIHVCFLFNNK